ncbi:MAG: HRDC domain-containing protein [Verrucomicrobiota bacterium]
MIDSDLALDGFLPKLRAADWIALDTEADSLHAYPEKLCLIQITLGEADFLIDPLARLELAPLWAELKRHPLILHGADYDLRLLRKIHGFVPDRIFDTMLASRLLGDREFGLVNLLKKYLDVVLEKGSQKADWAKRPLTPRMEAYARNDTHHLARLAGILKDHLRQKGRLAWAEQCCDRLIAECAIPSAPQPDQVWRVKGSHKLSRASLAVLRQVWHWREREALAANKPPFFVLSHDAMVEISAAAVERRPFEQWLPRHFSTRRQEGLQMAIRAGLALSPLEQPGHLQVRSRRQTEAERRRFCALEQHRDRRAAALGIDPTLIASRATLLALAHDWERAGGELMAWQKELLGGASGLPSSPPGG